MTSNQERSILQAPVRAAVITISTSVFHGEAKDRSGPRLAELASEIGAQVAAREVVPDDRSVIEVRLRHWADAERCELVLTTGGTGFAPTDVTPEATRGDRARGTWNPRGDACGLPRAHQKLAALPQRRRHPGPNLDRQSPR